MRSRINLMASSGAASIRWLIMEMFLMKMLVIELLIIGC